MTRPLFLASLADLEAQIIRNVRNDAELALVEQELRKRTTKRAKALLDQVGEDLRRGDDHLFEQRLARQRARAER